MENAEDMKKQRLEKLRHDIIADNKILFTMANRPMTETCMCWGLECDDGWLDIISQYAGSLEGLNSLFYRLFRIRVQSDQLKSKFGTLHWYTSTEIDPGPFICFYERMIEKLIDKLYKVDFKLKKIVDEPRHTRIEEIEVKPEDFERAKKHAKLCSNVHLEERDGKQIEVTELEVMERHHYVPTKHKLLYKLFVNRYKLKNLLRTWFWKPSKCQEAAAQLVDMLQEKIVRDAEKACYNVCERCGHQIGTDWSPRCETRGWITYICDECAEKLETAEYYKNGAIWKGSKCIKTKEEVDAEHAKIEEKLKKEEEDKDEAKD